eukprot:TRINITY_DN698_c0_g1_i2.p1 TRINITY_DN698_c0_g1~~TRINITY_DN698_c0_g1_i2.p1  ORF type:complete len:1293 (+),score=322.42 TRINITY_DN698_c0_g1_i2:106-3984(+)
MSFLTKMGERRGTQEFKYQVDVVIQNVSGLSSKLDAMRLLVEWSRGTHSKATSPAIVSKGTISFGDTLTLPVTVYYDPQKQSFLYKESKFILKDSRKKALGCATFDIAKYLHSKEQVDTAILPLDLGGTIKVMILGRPPLSAAQLSLLSDTSSPGTAVPSSVDDPLTLPRSPATQASTISLHLDSPRTVPQRLLETPPRLLETPPRAPEVPTPLPASPVSISTHHREQEPAAAIKPANATMAEGGTLEQSCILLENENRATKAIVESLQSTLEQNLVTISTLQAKSEMLQSTVADQAALVASLRSQLNSVTEELAAKRESANDVALTYEDKEIQADLQSDVQQRDHAQDVPQAETAALEQECNLLRMKLTDVERAAQSAEVAFTEKFSSELKAIRAELRLTAHALEEQQAENAALEQEVSTLRAAAKPKTVDEALEGSDPVVLAELLEKTRGTLRRTQKDLQQAAEAEEAAKAEVEPLRSEITRLQAELIRKDEKAAELARLVQASQAQLFQQETEMETLRTIHQSQTDEFGQLQNEHAKLQADMQVAVQDVQRLTASELELRSNFATLGGELSASRSEVACLQVQVSELTEQLALQSSHSLAIELQVAQEQVQKYAEEVDQLSNQLSDARAEKSHAELKVKRSEEIAIQAKDEMGTVTDRLATAEISSQELQEKLKRSEQICHELRIQLSSATSGSNSPTLRSQTDGQPELQQLQSSVANLISQKERLQSTIRDRDDRMQELQQELSIAQAEYVTVQASQDELLERSRELQDSFNARLESLEQEKAGFEEQVHSLTISEREARVQLDQMKRESEALAQHTVIIAEKENELAMLRSAMTQQGAELRDASGQVLRTTALNEELVQQVDRLAADKQSLHTQAAQLAAERDDVKRSLERLASADLTFAEQLSALQDDLHLVQQECQEAKIVRDSAVLQNAKLQQEKNLLQSQLEVLRKQLSMAESSSQLFSNNCDRLTEELLTAQDKIKALEQIKPTTPITPLPSAAQAGTTEAIEAELKELRLRVQTMEADETALQEEVTRLTIEKTKLSASFVSSNPAFADASPGDERADELRSESKRLRDELESTRKDLVKMEQQRHELRATVAEKDAKLGQLLKQFSDEKTILQSEVVSLQERLAHHAAEPKIDSPARRVSVADSPVTPAKTMETALSTARAINATLTEELTVAQARQKELERELAKLQVERDTAKVVAVTEAVVSPPGAAPSSGVTAEQLEQMLIEARMQWATSETEKQELALKLKGYDAVIHKLEDERTVLAAKLAHYEKPQPSFFRRR